MTSSHTAALALLAPVPRGAQTPASPDGARLRDEEAQLARLELSLAQAERAGDGALVGKLTVLRLAQQAKVLEARRTASAQNGVDEMMERLDAQIRAMRKGGVERVQ